MKNIAMKILVPFLFVYLGNCSSITVSKNEVVYTPNVKNGCASVEDVKNRLKCIGQLVKQIEDIKNSKVSSKKEKLERVDSKFVKYQTTFCLTDVSEKEKYFCFDSVEEVYEPTTTAKIIEILSRTGFGFVFGLATGIYVGN